MRTIRDRKKQNMIKNDSTKSVENIKKSSTRMRIISTLLIISLIFIGLSGVGNYQVYAETNENEQESEPIVTPTPVVENENPDGDNDPIEETTYDFEGSVNASNGMIILQSGLIIKETETGYEEVGTLVEGSYTFEDGSILHADGTITEPEVTPENEVTPTPEVTDNSELIASITSTIDSIISSPVFLSNVMENEDPENTEVSREDKIAALKRELLIYAEDEYPELVPYITDLSDFSETELNTIKSREVLSSLNALLGEIYSFIEMPVAMLANAAGCYHQRHTKQSFVQDFESHDWCTFYEGHVYNGHYVYCSFLDHSIIDGGTFEKDDYNNPCTFKDTDINDGTFNDCVIENLHIYGGTFNNCTINSCDIQGGTFEGCTFTNDLFFVNNKEISIKSSNISAPDKIGDSLISINSTGSFKAESVTFENIKTKRVIFVDVSQSDAPCCYITDSNFISNNYGISVGSGYAQIEKTTFSDSGIEGDTETTGADISISPKGKVQLTNVTAIASSDKGKAKDGGSIYNLGTLSIYDSSFSNYSVSNVGGAIYSNSTSGISIEGTTFAYNSAKRGGAIYCIAHQDTNIKNSTFTQNSATERGGAIFYGSYSDSNPVTLTLDSVTITDNSCSDSYGAGGIILTKKSKLLAANNTIIKDNMCNSVDSNLLFDHSAYGAANVNEPDELSPTSNKYLYLTLGNTESGLFKGEIHLSRINTTDSVTSYMGAISAKDSSKDAKLFFDNDFVKKFGSLADFHTMYKDSNKSNNPYWVLSDKPVLEASKFTVTSKLIPVGDTLYSDINVDFIITSLTGSPTLEAGLFKKDENNNYKFISNSNFNLSGDGTGKFTGAINSVEFAKTGSEILVVVHDTSNTYLNDYTNYLDSSNSIISGVATTNTISTNPESQLTPVITVNRNITKDTNNVEPDQSESIIESGILNIDLSNHNSINEDRAYEYYYGDPKNININNIITEKSNNDAISKEENRAGYYSVRYPAVYFATFNDGFETKTGIIYNGKNGFYYYSLGEFKNINSVTDEIKLVDASDWNTVQLLENTPIIANVDFSYSHGGLDKCGIEADSEILNRYTTKFYDKITAKVTLADGLYWGDISETKVGDSLKATWYYLDDSNNVIKLQEDIVTKNNDTISYTIEYKKELEGRNIYLKIEPDTTDSYHSERIKKCLTGVSNHIDTRKLSDFTPVNASASDASDGRIYGKDCDKLIIDPMTWTETEKGEHVKADSFINLKPGIYTLKYSACDGFMEGTETKTVEIKTGKSLLGVMSLSYSHTGKDDCTLTGPVSVPTALDTVTANFVLDSSLMWGKLEDGGYQYIGKSLDVKWYRYDAATGTKNYIKDTQGNEIVGKVSEDKSYATYILTGDDVGAIIGAEVLPFDGDIFHASINTQAKDPVIKHQPNSKKPKLTVTGVSEKDKKDGKITGTNLAKLDYKIGKDGKWISVANDSGHFKNGELTGLAQGTYYFRYAETTTNFVGTEVYEFTVGLKDGKVTPTPTPTEKPETGNMPKLVPSAQRTDSASPDPVAAADPEITEAVVDPDALAEIQKIKSSIASSDKIIVPNGENVYSQAELSSSEQELYDAVLTEEDKLSGKHITVSISCNKKLDGLTADEMNSIKGIAKGKDIGDVFDISIYKKYDTGEIVQVTETSKPVEVTVNVPLDIKNEGRGVLRKYSMIRFHQDELPVLIECTYDRTNDTVTFKSDKYSTYVLTYHDVPTVLSFGTWLWRLLSTKFLLIVSISMTLALLALYIWERKKGYYTGII